MIRKVVIIGDSQWRARFFYCKIRFELARLAAGPTVDTLPASIDDFHRFRVFFRSMAWAKQQRERQKWTRFDVFSQVQRWHAFMTIAKPKSIFFRGHFAMILAAFWRNFAWFWAPVWKPDLGLRMVLQARRNAYFSSLFEAFFAQKKSRS